VTPSLPHGPTPPPPPARAHLVAVTTAEAAGALLRDAWRGDIHVRPKGESGDVVTDLDVAAENLIVSRIRSAFPQHRVIAEEGGVAGAADSTWTWLVDPLDGTNNVALGLPACVIGIALCRGGVPVLGVIHDPLLRRTWSAISGRGARGPDGRPLRVTPRAPSRVLAWTQGYHVARGDRAARALKLVLEQAAHRLLQLWAPLLSWTMLSGGVIDGIVGYQPEEIDLPAGALIAQEAGIAIRALDGALFRGRLGTPTADRSFVAARPEMIAGLLTVVSAAQRMDGTWDVPVVPPW
jgi:myo-inositol-1(or 4)-monophosphatase